MKALTDLDLYITENKPKLYIFMKFAIENLTLTDSYVVINNYEYNNTDKRLTNVEFYKIDTHEFHTVYKSTCNIQSNDNIHIRYSIWDSIRKYDETIDVIDDEDIFKNEFSLSSYNYAMSYNYYGKKYVILLQSLSNAKQLTPSNVINIYKINDDTKDVKEETQEEIPNNITEETPIIQPQYEENDYEISSDCLFDISDAISYENFQNLTSNIHFTNNSIFSTNIQRSESNVQTIPPLHFDMSSQSLSPSLIHNETQYETHPFIYNSEYIFSNDPKEYSDMEAQTSRPELLITPLPESELHLFSLEYSDDEYYEECESSSDDISEEYLRDVYNESDPDNHGCSLFRCICKWFKNIFS